jgi:NodT family efflux transporter outer membrane factor (OMF) lipoprotein
MNRTFVPVISMLCLLAACTAGPSYVRPEVATGSGWAEETAGAEGIGDLGEWWRRFDDPTLDRLVTRALEQNFDLREAEARLAEARALRDAVAGGRYPSGELSASVTRRRQSENGPLPIRQFPVIERDQTIYEPGFDALWELDLFGRTRRAVEAADARAGAALEQQRAVRMSVVAETARSYFALRGAQHALDARQAAVAAARASSDLVARRFAAGDVPEAAVAQSEAELTALEAQLPGLQAEARTAALAISFLLGEVPEAELTLLDQHEDYVALSPLPVGERGDLLRRRPDVRAAERTLAAATADIGVAAAALFPSVKIGANGGFQSLATGQLFDSASEIGAVASSITWPLFNRGRIHAQVRAREARAEAAAADYEKAVQQALSDAERALSRYNLGLDALGRQQAAVAAARRSYGFAEDRYRAGDISLLELLDAERGLRNAEDAYARVHTAAATDLVALFKALGGGWGETDGAG